MTETPRNSVMYIVVTASFDKNNWTIGFKTDCFRFVSVEMLIADDRWVRSGVRASGLEGDQCHCVRPPGCGTNGRLSSCGSNARRCSEMNVPPPTRVSLLDTSSQITMSDTQHSQSHTREAPIIGASHARSHIGQHVYNGEPDSCGSEKIVARVS